jgi:hypothetical protein
MATVCKYKAHLRGISVAMIGYHSICEFIAKKTNVAVAATTYASVMEFLKTLTAQTAKELADAGHAMDYALVSPNTVLYTPAGYIVMEKASSLNFGVRCSVSHVNILYSNPKVNLETMLHHLETAGLKESEEGKFMKALINTMIVKPLPPALSPMMGENGSLAKENAHSAVAVSVSSISAEKPGDGDIAPADKLENGDLAAAVNVSVSSSSADKSELQAKVGVAEVGILELESQAEERVAEVGIVDGSAGVAEEFGAGCAAHGEQSDDVAAISESTVGKTVEAELLATTTETEKSELVPTPAKSVPVQTPEKSEQVPTPAPMASKAVDDGVENASEIGPAAEAPEKEASAEVAVDAETLQQVLDRVVAAVKDDVQSGDGVGVAAEIGTLSSKSVVAAAGIDAATKKYKKPVGKAAPIIRAATLKAAAPVLKTK